MPQWVFWASLALGAWGLLANTILWQPLRKFALRLSELMGAEELSPALEKLRWLYVVFGVLLTSFGVYGLVR